MLFALMENWNKQQELRVYRVFEPRRSNHVAPDAAGFSHMKTRVKRGLHILEHKCHPHKLKEANSSRQLAQPRLSRRKNVANLRIPKDIDSVCERLGVRQHHTHCCNDSILFKKAEFEATKTLTCATKKAPYLCIKKIHTYNLRKHSHIFGQWRSSGSYMFL
jgi:hypothetical protein